ncbi:MAG: pyridoxal phosphate-dependent aminotransferase [Vicinamibacterales bacterium]
MSFSRRMPADLQANALSDALSDARATGRTWLDLTESNPTRAGFDYPDDLLAPLADSRGLHYRPDALGAQVAREAVAADFARRGTQVRPEHVMLTVSTSDAYSVLFKLLCDPGDEVLIPQPSYPLFEHLTRLDSIVSLPYRLEYHGQWSIDVASIEAAMSPRTRAVLLVNPNNPTGSFVSANDVDRLAALCAARDVAIISDEVFADYGFRGSSLINGAPLVGRADVLGFTMGGLSKSVGLPQVKLAWTAVSGSADHVAAAMLRLELICDTYLSVSTPVQLALPELMARGAVIREQIQARVERNLSHGARLVAQWPSCSLLRADGGWSAVIRVPRLMTEEELVLNLLNEHGVLVHPGYFFDFAEESYVIVSLLVPEPVFIEGVTRVLHACGSEAR